MPDVPDVRRRIMAAVGSKNTKPERVVRSMLHAEGYRYRLHRSDLPGRPDIAFPSRSSVIEVRGCFWHSHEGCRRATVPATRRDFWAAKLSRNKVRDQANEAALKDLGWRVLIVWECELKDPEGVMTRIRRFLGPPGIHQL